MSPESCVFLGNLSVWVPLGTLEVSAGQRERPDEVSILSNINKDLHFDKTKSVGS